MFKLLKTSCLAIIFLGIISCDEEPSDDNNNSTTAGEVTFKGSKILSLTKAGFKSDDNVFGDQTGRFHSIIVGDASLSSTDPDVGINDSSPLVFLIITTDANNVNNINGSYVTYDFNDFDGTTIQDYAIWEGGTYHEDNFELTLDDSKPVNLSISSSGDDYELSLTGFAYFYDLMTQEEDSGAVSISYSGSITQH